MRTFPRRPALAVAAALALVSGASLAQGDTALSFSKMPVGVLTAPWHFATLPNKNATEFAVADVDGQHVLRVATRDAYGNMVHPLHQPPSASPQLHWRWRVDRLVEKADIKSKAGDDSALKLCVSFDYDKSQLSLASAPSCAWARSARARTFRPRRCAMSGTTSSPLAAPSTTHLPTACATSCCKAAIRTWASG